MYRGEILRELSDMLIPTGPMAMPVMVAMISPFWSWKLLSGASSLSVFQDLPLMTSLLEGLWLAMVSI